ncbi:MULTISPECIES: urease accessory protein UreE [Marinobacter]|uniref:Urease accessory protein UreE n=2 Tax=Marinobacter TaxID=2742 RepID=A0ABU2HL55_9GAMM|nr:MULTISPECIES: urease accessory protein UreE [Marinobacter]MBU2873566.1 urease accessory protein UreE [Marinobacter salexigens]MDS1311488.1 urease accessory protein UreE [Marinobacter sp. F60267]
MLELIKRITNVETTEILDNLTLPYELRMRGRLRATTETSQDVGLFLDRGPVLRDGDLLQAKTGEVIRVRAAEEPVVTARIHGGLPLARLCYHLGNRHVSLAIGEDELGSWIRFPPDHVLEELAERLGAVLVRHTAPFDPEPGAYAQAGKADGGHSHSHGHHHAHSH